jgi:aminoglycoside phosphotransferase (APT) family kinase protein
VSNEAEGEAREMERPTTSTRDVGETAAALQRWLAGKLPEGSDPELGDVVVPEGNGMSSETLLFTASWRREGKPESRRCVARIEPPDSAHPVFPSYDLDLQYRVMDLVGRATAVPVPEVMWFEGDRSVLGVPFFVMSRIDGEVPRDVMPYTFGDNFVADGSDGDRAALQRSAIATLAEIHTLRPHQHDLGFLAYDEPGASALERHLAHWRGYHEWVVATRPSPLLADCFRWLEDHFPEETGPDALSWGDSRIGNMMFVGTDVVAVFDWEMAGIAPPEVDAGWMSYLHQFFQDLTVDAGMPGLPGMFQPNEVRRTYQEVSGRELHDLRWYVAYAAIRHGVIMRRVTERSILFGQAEVPDDLDDLIMHRRTLEGMLDGSYWATMGW